MKRQHFVNLTCTESLFRLFGLTSLIFCISLVTSHWSLVTLYGGQLPSLFRGIVVADPADGGAGSPIGIRVVSVEETSQASLVDLRPEDLILQINDTPIGSIDEFAVVSQELKGNATTVTLLVLRNGQPREVILHLYSVPILRHWNLSFIPEHDLRFADPRAGVAYWMNLARGFETVGDREQALNAYLNALHNEPTDLDVALKVSELLWEIAQEQLKQRRLPDALLAIQQATVLLARLFDQSLNDSQLRLVKGPLEQTLEQLRSQRRENALTD